MVARGRTEVSLTVPIDITDPRLVKAYAHPLRIHILTALENRVASPSEIADELGTPLSNTSYHVRQLVALGLLDLVKRVPRRGAIEHYYTAKVRPTITDEGWGKLPAIVKRAYMGGVIEQMIGTMVAGAEQGGFDSEDIHATRTMGRLDRKGWQAVSREMTAALRRIDRIMEESSARLSEDPDAEARDATVLMLHFEGPEPRSLPPRKAGPVAALDAAAAKSVEEPAL